MTTSAEFSELAEQSIGFNDKFPSALVREKALIYSNLAVAAAIREQTEDFIMRGVRAHL